MGNPFERPIDRPLLLGVVHLLPLPGAPHAGPPLSEVLRRAENDARALRDGGADGVIVENLGDAPFAADQVAPWTVAALTRAVLTVQHAWPEARLGVNVLRNDARAALGIAAACGADFIRVNVHVGAMVTDQGLIEGKARQTLLDRRLLGKPIAIAADVMVKHAVPLGAQRLEDVARDAWHRGRADALIVTGSGTGHPTNPDDLRRVRAAVPDARLWLGSGMTPSRCPELAPLLDGAIVGTWFHEDSDLTRPLSADRVRDLRDLLLRHGSAHAANNAS